MDQVLFGDAFINIESHLSPKDLYQLSWSCKRFCKIITDGRIKERCITEMISRLRNSFGNNYDGFVDIVRKMDIVIVGSFITQCFLGETWQKSTVGMYTTTQINRISSVRDYAHFADGDDSTESSEGCNNELTTFLQSKGYIVTEPRSVKRYDERERYIYLYPLACIVNGLRTRLFPLYHGNKPISIEHYMHQYIEFDVCKNMYSFATNELYVHDMYGIYAKRESLPRSIDLSPHFRGLHQKGFQFYGPDNKLLSNYDILCSNYHVIKVTDRIPAQKTKGDVRYTIVDDTIRATHLKQERCTAIVFDVLSTSICDKNRHFYIRKCEHIKSCVVKLLNQNRKHLHGRHIGKSDREIVLIF